MKIAYGSDFHFEFYDNINIAKDIIETWVFEPDTDTIVIAGDLHVGAKKVHTLLNYIFDMYGIPIVYVPGNHEYYRSSFYRENDHFYRKGISHEDKFYILLRNSVEFSGQKFSGCLGNIDGSYEHISRLMYGGLNDFHMIKDFEDHEDLGKGEFAFFKRSVTEGSIVVTHTMPSPRCCDPKYAGSRYNACFANDWSEIIYNNRPKVWFCGHTHSLIDMVIEDTHIVANPYGYPSENAEWRWRYVNV